MQDEAKMDSRDLEKTRENLHTEYDIGQDIGCGGTDLMEEQLQNRLSDKEFRSAVQSLNNKQKEGFFLSCPQKGKNN